jgi:hypothetical protein
MASNIGHQQFDELSAAIRKVYLKVWDPIDVKDEPMAQDEYDHYIPTVKEILLRNGSDDEILNYLSGVENKKMGYDTKPEQLRAVASALRQIPISR